jgi:hypothetical protein
MEKDNFQTLAENRLEIAKRLAMDDELAKCLLNKSEAFKDTDITQLEKTKLINTQIYPYPKTSGTLTEAKSYITMGFKYRKARGTNIFKTASITIYVFCHESIVKTSYGVLRFDYIIQQIDRLLNDTRADGWIGKLCLDSMNDVIFDNNYIGLSVTYVNTEFQ